MKHFLVINPHSFRSMESLRQIIIDIDKAFSSKLCMDYKIYISRYPRDAIPAVHRYVSGCTDDEIIRVYAVGGDGILFDCLNGMVDFPNAELTSVPYGNDYDFIRSFGENVFERFRDFRELASSPSRPVDIIHCGSNYAIIEIQIGFVGQTVILAREMFRHVPEKILRKNIAHAYTICALRAMFNEEIRKQKYTILMDGEDLSGNYSHINIASSACTGGTMILNPYAKPDSGFLEVILTNTSKITKLIKTMGDYNKGHFEKHDCFIRKRCRKLEIKSDTVMSVEIDGEGFHAMELKLELIPGGIKFFAPEDLDFVDYSYRAYKGAGKKGGTSQ